MFNSCVIIACNTSHVSSKIEEIEEESDDDDDDDEYENNDRDEEDSVRDFSIVLVEF